ncbi:uncharacterized protein LOC129229421 isoform X2 [Uloborus diversus]|uniref:uncharacterized protein LOC129229421 isoform X2 n=1 Tax=Uloborus diversus TaxID=327109 RepID=UPI00240A6073|nr:uncharacterized protein LOC129229421 isoform X2 [Uloborus diversus]XP_054719701.1 uncharacterized protein LOC129229421 isoform X2 [Uloborus diversus]
MQNLVSVLASLTIKVEAQKMSFLFQILLMYLAKGQRMSQIRKFINVGENLQKNSQKSESCMLSMQNIMEEVKIISKDLKIVKETQAKLFRKIEENHEDYEKNIEILSSKISENAQYLKQLKLQAEKYDEQQNFCKKVFKDIEDEQKHFEKYTKNMVTDIGLKIHNSMRGLRDNLEENLDGKFSALRNFISISNEEKQRNDDYWRHKKLLSRQNIAIADSPCFVSTNYASSISKPNFEDGCRDNYGLNSEKYLMNSSNHLGERARNFSHYGIVPEDSPMFSKMLENKLQKSSTCNPFNYGAKFILKKNLNTSRGQNASNLNISKESLAKTQVKSGEKEVFAISPDVLSCDEMGYVGKLRSSKRKTLNAKRTAVPLPKKKRKNCSKNQKQKKIKKTTPQNQNDKSNSIKTVKAPVMRKLKSSSKTITATSNAGVTSCTLFSASFCSSPGLNLYEAMNFKKEQQYFA